MQAVELAFELGEPRVRTICARLSAKDPTLELARDLHARVAFCLEGVNRLVPIDRQQSFAQANVLEFLFGLQRMLDELRSIGKSTLELPEWEPQAEVVTIDANVVFRFEHDSYTVPFGELEIEVLRFTRNVSAHLVSLCPALRSPELVPGWIATLLRS